MYFHFQDKKEIDFTYSQHVQVPLADGTLLVMEGATQTDWQVRLASGERKTFGARFLISSQVFKCSYSDIFGLKNKKLPVATPKVKIRKAKLSLQLPGFLVFFLLQQGTLSLNSKIFRGNLKLK